MAVFPVSSEAPIQAVPYVAPEGKFVHYEGSPFELYQPYHSNPITLTTNH